MFNDTEKYVINLKRRPDRLDAVLKEFDYVGMDVKVFEAIDTNSFLGATQSHKTIIQSALDNKLEQVIVFEDDVMFMPYAKSLLIDIEEAVKNIEYGILNLNPAFHTPVNLSSVNRLLIDLTNRPPSLPNHRGVYGAGFMVYHKSVYEDILNTEHVHALDYEIDLRIYPKYPCYSPAIPIGCSTNGVSDVSGVFFNTYYTQTYNWNLYCPDKIPSGYLNEDYVVNLRKNGVIDYKTLLK